MLDLVVDYRDVYAGRALSYMVLRVTIGTRLPALDDRLYLWRAVRSVER